MERVQGLPRLFLYHNTSITEFELETFFKNERINKTTMIQVLKSLFKKREIKTSKKYKSLSDFFANASVSEQRKIFTDVAHRSNEDQLKVFKEAHLKTRAN